MKTQFTKLTANFGCYAEDGNCQDQFLKTENFTIEDVLNAKVPLKDKVWFMRHNCEFTNTEYRESLIGIALYMLPLYKKIYPEGGAARKAIDAANAYLAGSITLEELRIVRTAITAFAYADTATTYAAYATYAATDAAASADPASYFIFPANLPLDYENLLLQFFKEFINK